ncbi:DEAD/DEAH box helicase family protein [Lactobacillus amylovorus]|uniref:DEAD/DEAH box helicase family protein n=1 Tax=Lactobacillus amylovorus TaxID=1604 RepID=A0A9X3WAD6_LACAM|nr:type ISP restriction/modification enzyme [Lactobacillus amylovorus]MDB6262104.1 DEAD/DEAH box helicase family protein [Lactobacillus amylovorus]
MATFDELVKQVNDNLTKERDRGTAFEKMVVAYLKNEPAYKQKFQDVWMLNEVPAEYHISKKDTGVDIVAKDYDGNLTAVQAKFYKGKVSKAGIDSFVAETGKKVYSAGMLVSSTDDWNRNARKTLDDTTKPFTVIGLSQLRHADFDWQKFSFAKENTNLSKKKPKKLRPYQETAINNSLKYFKEHDRGKLIMAPGTGKTFTSLKIAEALMRDQKKKQFNVLYLVPSIQLLSQTLFSWNSDISDDIHMTSLSVVSDTKANKQKDKNDDDLGAREIGFEPTTNVQDLVDHYKLIEEHNLPNDMRVVFSTYQSIDVIKQAQKDGYPEFDLIIADEAHRTTGAIAEKEGDTTFTEVHSNTNVKGKLRLYQTATPKIYDQNAKKKAKENSIVVSSMDDKSIYGDEIFRLGFGDAVAQGYLTDYKVSVLAVSESYINKDMQKIMSADNQLKVDDIGKIIGVWNAMVKRDGITGEITGAPMKRAIAFTDTIKHSKIISNEFNQVVNDYLDSDTDDNSISENSYHVDVHHVDGSLNALQKEEQIDWLGNDDIEDNHARVLSNVRFLTEGIDVPNLDAIIFFSPKKSQVDIVQAVGRIMRRAENKEYGYIILPIVVANGVDPHVALDNDKKYKQVWQVLNALRSTDERFDAEVNTLDLNKKKSGRINIIGVDTPPKGTVTEEDGKNSEPESKQLSFIPEDWIEMRNAFYGKIVQHVGDRRYLEDWSKDVADIAKMYVRRINDLIDSNQGAKLAFDKFLKSLRYNINDSIDQEQAVEMLAQHLITEPVFNALFSDYDFVRNNAVSKSMNDIISAFKVFGFAKEQEQLKPFYDSVKLRASGIDNIQGKQTFIIQLYNSFFKTAFPRVTESMGIVFTPVEVVDFIIHSVDWALNKYFGKSLASKNVHILDPFTGTGTFITRTLYYLKQQMDEGKITYDDILRKYMHELHANEIVLLSYYIAAINIEAVFDEVNGPDRGYKPFDGIVLTDTFESTEREDTLDDDMFGTNNQRLKEQQKQPITAIISNPPYSVGQRNLNDNNENTHYKRLEELIHKDYVETSKSGYSKGAYDSYIKAIKWSTERLKDEGIIGFITNSGYIDKSTMDGMRAALFREFNHIFVINLRGGVRGKLNNEAKKEGGNIFDIMTGVAISIFIKDNTNRHEIQYYDVGDYKTKKEKLNFLDNHSLSNISFNRITPDINNDWINQKDLNYQKYMPLSVKGENSIFYNHALGITTNRDQWVYGFSKDKVRRNVLNTINHFNSEVLRRKKNSNFKKNNDPKYIKWTSKLNKMLKNGDLLQYHENNIVLSLYRPFTKKWLYYDNDLNERTRLYSNGWNNNNELIFTSGRGARNPFSLLATNLIPSMDANEKGQGFYKDGLNTPGTLINNDSNITTEAEKKFQLSKDDLFDYVYGILNSYEYQDRYQNDLRKDLARIPNVRDKEKYVETGKKLINLHINYENVPIYDKVNIQYSGDPDYRVEKMKFSKKRSAEGKLEKDRSTIIFNDSIIISNIPEKAYEYIVNGKSAIEWIMDQYQVKTDKKSGITDDPNDYSDDPKYIFNLLLRIINVSVQTVDLINQLPPLEIEE